MEIHVNHDSFSKSNEKVHLDNIENFKTVANSILDEIDGKFLVDYIPTYQQFDVLERPETITQQHIAQIEELYPNAFI